MNPVQRPALERRAKFVERQPRAVRRRSVRALSRLAVLFSLDVLAYVAARASATAVVGPLLVGGAVASMKPAGPLAPPGAPASLVFPMVLLSAMVLTGAYARHRASSALRVLSSAILAAIATTVALAALVGVRGAAVHSATFAIFAFLFLVAGRSLAALFLDRVWPRDRGAQAAVQLFGSSGRAADRSRRWGDYLVADELSYVGESAQQRVSAVMQKLHGLALRGVEVLIVGDDLPEDELAPLIFGGLDLGYRVVCPARAISLEHVIRPRLIWHRGEPFLEISTPVLRASAVVTKRLMDVLGSGVLLLTASPLMAAIAIAVRLDSPGPAFFTQDRAGLGGRRFRMLKFRTMTVDADQRKAELAHLNRSGDGRLYKIPGDPRVTRLGKFLRRWSLDELPQFVNVLRGDMSLVGPRPFFESDFSEYEDRHFRRLDTKPGITGLWQVSGRSDVVEFEDVIFLDRQYIEQWSLWLDLSILARTIPAVLRRQGAY